MVKKIIQKHSKIIKVGLVIVGIYIIATSLSIDSILKSFRELPLLYYLLFFLTLFTKIMLNAVKWRMVVNSFGSFKLPFWTAFKAIVVADFMSSFGVGGVGSDVYKISLFEVKKHGLKMVTVERILSLLTLILVTLTLSIFLWFSRVFFVALLSFLAVILFILFFKKLLDRLFGEYELSLKSLEIKLLFTITTLLLIGALEYYIYYSYFIDISLINFMPKMIFLLGVLSIVVSLPISYKGVGIREVFLLFFGNTFHWNVDLLLSINILMYSVMMVYQIIGLFFYLFIPKNTNEKL